MAYQHLEIEKKWQQYWDDHHTFKTEENDDRPNYYVLDMFPYPSGEGLHVGHPKGYTATDVVARVKRAQGYNVLHPMGWDAFGLPAEQYALDTGNDPHEFTQLNIGTLKRQIKSLGFSYDWEREIDTTDPNYYKWTQWIFSKLYEEGLAYEAEVSVNWCEALGTVLSNEEVIDGLSERGGHPVVRRPMRQWVLRITEYADRLLEDLDDLDWPESLKDMQRNWIGRSEGARVNFRVVDSDDLLETYTTRPDTLFGATYLVIAPEHALVSKLTTPEYADAVEEYVTHAATMSELERTSLNKDKTGVFTGSFASHPVTGKPMEIWVADYVLAGYGTGAIMAVPAHDERDYEFAKEFNLPIVPIIEMPEDHEEGAYTGDGVHINSDFLNGLSTDDSIRSMIKWLETNDKGEAEINYRLRDWLFSRQRYWGEPIPVIHWEDGTSTLVPEEELPVLLPKADNIHPSGTGESPLANLTDWLNVVDEETGLKGKRETNTMPQWAGSSWYYLRFMNPHNDEVFASEEALERWQNVDLYIGGAEHAVLHLLYARFWHKVLYDLDLVPTKEPFKKLFNQGMILGEDGEKMSKSIGNVVNPDDVVEEYGADTLRLYEMFMGPLDGSIAWSERGLGASRRFLDRVYRQYVDETTGELHSKIQETTNDALESEYHKMVMGVTDDFEHLHFNTAISKLMIFMNAVRSQDVFPREYAVGFLQLLAPLAPHLAEELWKLLGHEESIQHAPWPTYDESLTVEDTVEIVVQLMGKIVTRLDILVGLSPEDLEEIALADEKVQEAIEGLTVRKVIAIPDRLVNIVAN